MAALDVVQFALRLGLAGVFALAGVTKLFDRDGFQRAFVEFGGPRRAARASSFVVPPLELAVAAALVPAATSLYGAVGAIALLLVFTAAIGLALARGRAPNCHCFGQLRATVVGWGTLARNGVLLSAAVAIIALQSADPVSVAAIFAGGLALSALAAVGLRLTGLAGRRDRRARPAVRTADPVPIDSRAPDFALQDLDGATVTLGALLEAGRPILLLFLGPGCGQCGALLPEVSRWQREHDDVLTLALVSHGPAAINRGKFGGHGLKHLLLQRGREVSESYGAMGTPSAMIVRTDGTIGSALARGDVEVRQLVGDWTGDPEDLPVARTAETDAAVTAFLRLAARLDGDAEYYRVLASTAARLDNWQGLVSMADAHGLAPLVFDHLRKAGIDPPTRVRRELLAATMVHGAANRARFRVLGEMLDAFDRASIPVVVLKGAALAHLLYPSAALRPLRVIDLMVAPELAPRAQELLASEGFAAPLTRERRGRRHDDFPAVMKVAGGAEVRIKLHTNALTGATQEFLIEGRPARALGHTDMLYHLYRHMAEPAERMRLIWVADIVGYAVRHRNEIPWAEVRRRYPSVLNALSLLDLVTPLPPELAEHLEPTRDRWMRGVGVVSKPPDDILRRDRPVRGILRDIFDPSDWWLRLHYGLGGGASLQWYRYVRHPLRVGSWFMQDRT